MKLNKKIVSQLLEVSEIELDEKISYNNRYNKATGLTRSAEDAEKICKEKF